MVIAIDINGTFIQSGINTNITINETRYIDQIEITDTNIHLENYKLNQTGTEDITMNITVSNQSAYENQTNRSLPYIIHESNIKKLLDSQIYANIISMNFAVDKCTYNSITFWKPANVACAANSMEMLNTYSDYKEQPILLSYTDTTQLSDTANPFNKTWIYIWGIGGILFILYCIYAYYQVKGGYWGVGYLATYTLIVFIAMFVLGILANIVK